LRSWASRVTAVMVALIVSGVIVRAWKKFDERRSAPTFVEQRAEPVRLSTDALPQRIFGKPLQNKYLSAPLQPTNDDVRRLIEGVEFDLWFGLYIGDKKVGFAREVMRKTAPGEPGAYFSSFDMAIRAGYAGDMDVSYEFEAQYHSGEAPFRLLAVKSRTKSGDGDVVRDFSFTEQGGSLTETIDGELKPARAIAATKDTLTGLFASTVAGPEHVKPGQTATFPLFDAEQLKDDSAVVTIESVGERRVAGVDLPVAMLSVHTLSDNVTVTVNVARGGRGLDLSMGDVALRPEPRDLAIEDAEGFDGLFDGVPIDQRLGDPASVMSLNIDLTCAKSYEPPNRPNQLVEHLGEGRYRIKLAAAPGAAVTELERSKALLGTGSIDLATPALEETAKRITSRSKTRGAAVAALLSFVDREVEDISTDLSQASQVLERQIGDCTEHTLLFIALCRSIGIPARELSGLAYISDSDRRFGWHAWAEVEVDGHWVAVDPTLAQAQADATHVVLGVDEDARWTTVLSSMKIDVIE
jgi:hypothetical protein